MIAEEDFQRVIMRERKRTERTRKPFLLMLLDMGGGCTPSEKDGKIPETVLSALPGFTSDTDVTAWYKNDSVLGVYAQNLGLTIATVS
jgi:hypothetical protein